MKAAPGDRLVIRPHSAGGSARDALILEVRGAGGGPPYLVQWSDDGHVGLLFPGSDAHVEHLGAPEEPTAEAEPVTEAPQVTVLDRDAIARLPERPFEGAPGVKHATLWQRGGELAGLLWLQPGAVIPNHAHEREAHHAWVLEGAAEVNGHRLEGEGYWHIPPGLPHELAADATSGCRLLYLYLRQR